MVDRKRVGQKRLTYAEIITALRAKVPNKSFKRKEQLIDFLVTQIEQRRVDKPLTESLEDDLRQAGAPCDLIDAIRANSPPLPTPIGVSPLSELLKSAAKPGEVRKNAIGMELVWIPGGEFMMGSSETEVDDAHFECKKYYSGCKRESFTNEMPKHKVTITAGFWMGKYEVTQGQWQAVMGDNPSKFTDCGANCPVEQVSWDDIQVFTRRLNAKNDGFEYSLPSEAQWEYAARAGTTTAFAFGDSLNSSQANFNGDNPYRSTKGKNIGKTVRGGCYQPNAWGLYDMHGNVWEWVQDTYNSTGYSGLPTDGSANVSQGDSNFRTLRGGSWSDNGDFTRSAVRDGLTPSFRNVIFDYGFRVAARPK